MKAIASHFWVVDLIVIVGIVSRAVILERRATAHLRQPRLVSWSSPLDDPSAFHPEGHELRERAARFAKVGGPILIGYLVLRALLSS